MTGRRAKLTRIGLNVTDLARAQAYYCAALGFTTSEEEEPDPAWVRLLAGEGARARIVKLRLGGQVLELMAFDPPGAGYPPDSTAADLWFQHFAIATHDMTAAYRRLAQYGATPITHGGPQRLPPGAGSVGAFKFRDPDGHPLELIHFPPGSGDPAWQCASPDPTLGIDHSALSVADAERSLAFYDRLGLDLRSRQINSGPEQDRLDGLCAVSVAVIGLSPAGAPTPHVELLCYHQPRGRRADPSFPASAIADSRLILQVGDLTGLVEVLAAGGATVSPMVALAAGTRAALVRDPDGHAIVLLEDPQDAEA